MTKEQYMCIILHLNSLYDAMNKSTEAKEILQKKQ